MRKGRCYVFELTEDGDHVATGTYAEIAEKLGKNVDAVKKMGGRFRFERLAEKDTSFSHSYEDVRRRVFGWTCETERI